MVKSEAVSRKRKGMREYLNNKETNRMSLELDKLFELKVVIPLMRQGKNQKIKTLINEQMSAGTHAIDWDGTDQNGADIASGVYLYRLSAGKFAESKRMVLMK